MRSEYALVTGASRGIGLFFARALAARGKNLILVARSSDLLQVVAGELRRDHSIQVETISLDLAVPQAGTRLGELLRERGIGVDLLVNNAGLGTQGRFWQIPAPQQPDMVQLNIGAIVDLTYALLPEMIERKRGAIINVSSIAGFQAMPYAANYAATKAFVTSFSVALAEEVRQFGITVVTLCPGQTQTKPVDGSGATKSGMPGGRQPADEVVAEALRCLDQGGGVVVPRLLNKIMALWGRLLPPQWSAKLVERMSRGSAGVNKA